MLLPPPSLFSFRSRSSLIINPDRTNCKSFPSLHIGVGIGKILIGGKKEDSKNIGRMKKHYYQNL
jgi:hypothetical protein